MSKQPNNKHTGFIIGAGAVVIALMAAALLFLRWTLNADPASAPPMIVTAVVMILPVIVMFILFVVVMKRVWPAKPVDRKGNSEAGGDA